MFTEMQMKTAKFIRTALFSTLIGVLCATPIAVFAGEAGPGTFVGTFSAPVLTGNIINPDGSLTFFDNSASAPPFFTGFGSNHIVWGTNAQTNPPPFSFLTFTGLPFGVEPVNTPFTVGQIEFGNGTSRLDSLIFGATLTLTLPGATNVPPVVVQLVINTTSNGGISQVLDADNLQFLGQFPQALLAFEGGDITANLIGEFVGDPVLNLLGLTLPPGQDVNGLIGIGPSAVPEPSSIALLAIGLLMLTASLHRAHAARRPMDNADAKPYAKRGYGTKK